MIQIGLIVNKDKLKGGITNDKSSIQEITLCISQLELFKKSQLELLEKCMGGNYNEK